MSSTWHGDEIATRGKRAIARATVGWGVHMGVEMQNVAHTVSTDLRNSIHAAAARNTAGSPDADALNVEQGAGFTALVEVGSWLPYACVEENRGGDHRFATRGYEAAHGLMNAKIERAFREEGL